MKPTVIALLIGLLGWVAGDAQASAPTTAALTSGGKTTVAVCFPACVDSTAVDPVNYTLNGGAGVINAPIILLPDSRTVLMDVSGLTGATYGLDVAGGQIQYCAGGTVAGVTLTGALDSRFGLAEVGAPSIASRFFTCSPGKLNLIAGGNAYAGASDELAFAYESITGDFDRKVQISGISVSDATDNFGGGGLMVRGSTDPVTPALELFATQPLGDNAVQCLVRGDAGNPYDEVDRAYSGVAGDLPNQWLRMKRVGNDFQMFVGVDGVQWSLVAQRWQELPAMVLVGCYAAASKEGSTARVDFNSYTNVNLGDHTAPILLSAGTLDRRLIGVKFSKTLNSATAAPLANFTVLNSNNNPATVTGASVGIEGDAVYLSVTGLTSDTFTVRVNGGVTDSAGNAIVAPVSVPGKVSTWLAEDIGYFQNPLNRPLPGDDPIRIGQSVAVSSETNPEVEIIGGGSNLRNAGDYGHYLHRTMSGDFDVMVEITRFDRCYQTGGFPGAGLMARNGLYATNEEFTADGTKVPFYANLTCAEDTAGIGAFSVWRDAQSGLPGNSVSNKGVAVFTGTLIGGINGVFGSLRAANARGDNLPNSSTNGSRWLRLRRVGNHFTSYASYDGKIWQQFEDADHPLNSVVEVGIFTMNDSGENAPQENAYDGGNQRASMYSVVHVRHLGTTPLLNLARLNNSSATLSWTNGRLECAPTVSGPWSLCANQANPQTITVVPTGPRFYRLHL